MPSKKDTNMDEETFFVNAFSDVIGNIKEVSTQLPDMYQLQRAIINGLSSNYRNESDRLKQKYGKSNARTNEMDDLVEDLEDFKSETESGIKFVQRTVETISKDNVFHGYVYDAEGEPAENYNVILKLADKRFASNALSSKVDNTGYFYIDLAQQSTGDKGEDVFGRTEGKNQLEELQSILNAEGNELSERLKKIFRDEGGGQNSEEKEAEKAAGKNETAEIEIESQVSIENTKGKVVLRDNAPPTFTPPMSMFKRYQIDSTG